MIARKFHISMGVEDFSRADECLPSPLPPPPPNLQRNPDTAKQSGSDGCSRGMNTKMEPGRAFQIEGVNDLGAATLDGMMENGGF